MYNTFLQSKLSEGSIAGKRVEERIQSLLYPAPGRLALPNAAVCSRDPCLCFKYRARNLPKVGCAMKLWHMAFGTGHLGIYVRGASVAAGDLPVDEVEAAAYVGITRVVSLQSWRVVRVFHFPSIVFCCCCWRPRRGDPAAGTENRKAASSRSRLPAARRPSWRGLGVNRWPRDECLQFITNLWLTQSLKAPFFPFFFFFLYLFLLVGRRETFG